ncbi:carboxylesterase/lipase family protein [Fibrella aquatilis]|uniref:Carboxylic ester hydrolase n=1 Tax=Fibrella aquatilis TaxID=2817059 RepID=A0A939G2V0_9BACT|nr:carboxylesterase family protein [Fibrella aquatilis]MBO0929430.1 carboxylesterase family protein [Fibrella aquatilis]
MTRSILFLLCLFLATTAFSPETNAPEPIRITGGLVVGTLNQTADIQTFKGIPFAAPPVGDLRWKAPQPVQPWTGIRQCNAFGPSPMQGVPAPFGPWSAEFLIPAAPISEDCLYLNVWTGTAKTTARRPVLVWIYGGGFGSGGSGAPIYDGEATARKGIVFVSINYRVGPFGFFAHPELSGESGRNASGNYGLMDQIAALRWVQANIAQFGGDPANVTIAGQSAGSMSVNCLVASPVAKGLFTKAIAESGASFARPQPLLKEAEANGLTVMSAMGASSLAELRAKPAAELLQKGQGALRGPIVDGYVLPKTVACLFADGTQNDVALLTGWNEDEGMAFGPPPTAADYRQQVEKQYGADAPQLLHYYPATTDAAAATSQMRLSRDVTFGVQNYRWATLQNKLKKPVYVYRFTRKLPATGQYASYGAFHTGEVAYAYDNLRFIDHALRLLEPADEALAHDMAAYWANFIKTGNPNGSGLPRWPAFAAADKQVMLLGTSRQSQPLPDAAGLDVLFGVLSK